MAKLSEAMSAMRKLHGEGVAIKGSEKPQQEYIPTGIFLLDFATLGGIPRHQATEIYGWEGAGKSWLLLRMLGMAQRLFPEETAVLIDLERVYDPVWGEAQGIDNEKLMLIRPPNGEAACDIIDALVESDDVSLIGLDSLPNLIPKGVDERSVADVQPAAEARLIGRFLSKINNTYGKAAISNTKAPALIVINQWRMKIGVMHGDPRTRPGGMRVRYAVALSLEIMKKEVEGRDSLDHSTVSHNEHSFKITKVRGNSIKSGEFVVHRNPDGAFPVGFVDDGRSVVTFLKDFGYLTGAAGAYKVEGINEEVIDRSTGVVSSAPKRFRKYDDLVVWFYENPEVFEAQKQKLISAQRHRLGLE